MLTRTQLAELYRSLGAERVLSVYIDGTATDPAQRLWRLQLDNSLTDLRTWLEGSPHVEREQFNRCVERLKENIGSLPFGIGAPGWAAFITKDGIRDAHQLPVPVSTLAVWSTGPCLAPYMRALKESRPVVVAVTDATKADLYQYRLGRLEPLETVRAHHVIKDAPHMSAPPRQGFHKGTGGPPGRDSAQRSLLAGRDRMLAEAADRITDLAGKESWILLGGIKREVAQLAKDLESTSPNRVLELDSLDVHASEAEIAEAARAGASTLRDDLDAKRIEEIAGLAAAHGLGAIGPGDTRMALSQASVRELYLTHRYLLEHASETEEAIRAALDQDASVEEVSGRAAALLDEHGGLAAGLRFRPSAIEGAVAVETKA
jgi:hypothetical protein